MANREIPEVNAGSMADIAFLLLVFFLVTTTINKAETGIRSDVPPPPEEFENPDQPPPPPVEPRDLFMIYANKENRLLIEKKEYEPEEVSKIYNMTIQFYDSHERARDEKEDDIDGDGNTDFPIRWKVTKDTIDVMIRQWEQQVAIAESNNEDLIASFNRSMLNIWQKKMRVYKTVGSYYELPDVASIIFETDEETDYGFYLSVLDQVKAAQKKVMNDFALDRYGSTYDELNPADDFDTQKANAEKIEIIHMLYPPDRLTDKSEKDLGKKK